MADPAGALSAPAGLATTTLASPVGELRVVAGPRGLRAVLWPGEDGSRVARALVPPAPQDALESGFDPGELAERALLALAGYFAGDRLDLDLPLDPVGTAFQLRAWEALRAIPAGQTRSYAQQAAAIGRPGAARAVGSANRANPLSIVVPCHRVVSSGGSLTGFAGGLATKAWLLAHERAVLGGDSEGR